VFFWWRVEDVAEEFFCGYFSFMFFLLLEKSSKMRENDYNSFLYL